MVVQYTECCVVNSFFFILEANDDTVESSEILELAREQRMSTDIRKNIFCLIMTSEVISIKYLLLGN